MIDLAELEGLAMGLEQRGEKSAAHRVSMAVAEIERLRKLLTRAHTELPSNSTIRHDIELAPQR